MNRIGGGLSEKKLKGRSSETERLHNEIRADFERLKSEGFKTKIIIKKLAKKYYRAYSTIRDIVYKN